MEKLVGCAANVAVYVRGNGTGLTSLTAGLICAAFFGLGQPASAAEPGIQRTLAQSDAWSHHSDAFAVLVEYARQVGAAGSQPTDAEQPKLVSAEGAGFHGGTYQDPAYSALADFVQQIGAGQPSSAAGTQSQAGRAGDASTLIDRLAEVADSTSELPFVMAQNAAKKTPTAVKAPAASEATIVGSQACMKCHASHAASFDRTLMGKYGKVKKGTMECENCHGAGSAHVKAGGGRGVEIGRASCRERV